MPLGKLAPGAEQWVRPSASLQNVRYEIRGKLARRAHELERLGYDIISLNIGNPLPFGFARPETMRLAMIENLPPQRRLRASEGHLPGARSRRHAAAGARRQRCHVPRRCSSATASAS